MSTSRFFQLAPCLYSFCEKATKDQECMSERKILKDSCEKRLEKIYLLPAQLSGGTIQEWSTGVFFSVQALAGPSG